MHEYLIDRQQEASGIAHAWNAAARVKEYIVHIELRNRTNITQLLLYFFFVSMEENKRFN